MNYFFTNIALALVWAALNGDFQPASLAIGFSLSYFILAIVQRAFGPSPYFSKARRAIQFLLLFLWELLLSNLRVAYDVLTPRNHMQPRIIAVPLDAKTDTQIAALANLVSLTPGSLVLDVSTDRQVLYVHAMYAANAEAARSDIKNNTERWVIDLLSIERT